MASIRKTRTASGATAVQVVRYVNRRVVVLKHMGRAHDQAGVDQLVDHALAWYDGQPQGALFPTASKPSLVVEGTEFLGAWHTFAHDVLSKLAEHCGFHALGDALLLDLAIMRLVEPTSKLRSLHLLEEHFGIHHARRSFYRRLSQMVGLKGHAEQIAVRYAQDSLRDGLSLVLYDVTTLYFETFTADELRVPGFSKDNMAQQPQVVVGLLVTRSGFPLGFEVFPGNTFEGKTMLPVLEAFIVKHGVSTPTVVADAAMLSQDLLKEIARRGMCYIVAARLANAAPALIAQVSKALDRQDGRCIRLPSPHGDMVCSFSTKRYKKDKHTLDKAIAKAQLMVEKGEPGKRAKFVKAKAKDGYLLDQGRIEGAMQLLGVKGYCTNIPQGQLDNASVIARYHDLWHVEKAFRMAKSDLASRPVFHFEQRAIRVHLLICFIALAMARAMELRTGTSLRQNIDALWKVTDARLHNHITGHRTVLRSPLSDQAAKIMVALEMSY
jgi:hypothetical protein